MDEANFFQQALVYLIAAVISVPIAKRLGFGSVLGYLVAGIAIGPFALGLIGEEGEDVMHFAEFGVVMMLFLIGLEMKPNRLWQMRRSIFGLGGLQLVLSALAIGGLAMGLGLAWRPALAVGLMLGLSSTAIVLQTLAEKNLMKQSAGQASFSVLLFQDIAVIPILALLPLLAMDPGTGGNGHAEEMHHFLGREITGWYRVVLILAIITGIVVVGRYLALFVFRIIARTGLREIFTATALLLVIASAILMEMVDLSPALGAFLAGVVLANNEYRHELEADIEPFKGLLLGLFFISVGASVDFSLFASMPWIILGLLFLLMAVKFIILFALGRGFGLRKGQNTLFSFALAQGGEFAFVLVAYGLDNGVVDSQTGSLVLIVVALSMALTPLLLLFNDRVVEPRLFRGQREVAQEEIPDEENPVIIAGFGRFGVVIGRFLAANGIKATVLDGNPDSVEILSHFGFKVYYGDVTRPDLLRSAGADKARVIVVAVDDKQQSLRIIDQVKRHYPHLKIMVRAMDLDHTYELMKRGVDAFDRDVFESSLQLGTKVLTQLGYRKYQAHRLARTFRKHNGEMINDLCKHHGEEEKYLYEAKKWSRELEEILLAEQEDTSWRAGDDSWDDSSRREEARSRS